MHKCDNYNHLCHFYVVELISSPAVGIYICRSSLKELPEGAFSFLLKIIFTLPNSEAGVAAKVRLVVLTSYLLIFIKALLYAVVEQIHFLPLFYRDSFGQVNMRLAYHHYGANAHVPHQMHIKDINAIYFFDLLSRNSPQPNFVPRPTCWEPLL